MIVEDNLIKYTPDNIIETIENNLEKVAFYDIPYPAINKEKIKLFDVENIVKENYKKKSSSENNQLHDKVSLDDLIKSIDEKLDKLEE